MFVTGYASMSGSLADPPGSSVIVAAVEWIEATLLGTVATTVAIIAVASVGIMLFTGRINYRYGFSVIIGSFILFGATTIMSGLRALMTSTEIPEVAYMAETPPVIPPAPARPADYDPFAGASVQR
jgi:type IV secretion system protein VirB2